MKNHTEIEKKFTKIVWLHFGHRIVCPLKILPFKFLSIKLNLISHSIKIRFFCRTRCYCCCSLMFSTPLSVALFIRIVKCCKKCITFNVVDWFSRRHSWYLEMFRKFLGNLQRTFRISPFGGFFENGLRLSGASQGMKLFTRQSDTVSRCRLPFNFYLKDSPFALYHKPSSLLFISLFVFQNRILFR